MTSLEYGALTIVALCIVIVVVVCYQVACRRNTARLMQQWSGVHDDWPESHWRPHGADHSPGSMPHMDDQAL